EQRTDHGQHARELSEAIVGPEHRPYHVSSLYRTQRPEDSRRHHEGEADDHTEPHGEDEQIGVPQRPAHRPAGFTAGSVVRSPPVRASDPRSRPPRGARRPPPARRTASIGRSPHRRAPPGSRPARAECPSGARRSPGSPRPSRRAPPRGFAPPDDGG